jgi:hypothetical protein
MAYLIDGTTELPENGETGWGTILNAAINSIDNRFVWVSSEAVAKKVAASGITGSTLASNVVTSSLTTVGTLGSLAVSGNVTIGGDFTVNGTTTTINTATLNVSDNIIVLNNDVTGSPTENAGIEVERGTSTNVLIRWNETTDVWELTNDGAAYSTIATVSGSESLTNKKLGSLTTNGLVTTSGGDGTLSVTTLGANVATFLSTPSSANLASAITDETGSGALVFGTSPAITSPAITTSLTTPSASFDLVNATATTVNFAGAATALTVGATTGTTTVRNGLTVTGPTILGPAVITQQSIAYTLVLSDAGDIVEMTNGTDVNLTVPPEASVDFPVGTQITIIRNGAGKVQFVAGAGVTLRSDASKQFISTQYSAATLIKRAADEWYVVGNLAAS